MPNQPEASPASESLMQESRLHLETALGFAKRKMPKASLSYAARAARLFLEAYYLEEQAALPLKGPGYDIALLRHAAGNGQIALADELLLRTVWYVSEHYDYVLPHPPGQSQILNLLAKLSRLLERLEGLGHK